MKNNDLLHQGEKKCDIKFKLTLFKYSILNASADPILVFPLFM